MDCKGSAFAGVQGRRPWLGLFLSGPAPLSQVTFSADDFGLSVSINAGIERAYREGILDAASLMVSGPAAADAVARARANPGLRVGLHLVVVEGRATLPAAQIPALVDQDGWFDSRQIERGFRYFLDMHARRQLACEIEAQYAAFAATGLTLDHANAHKHMHLHPTVGAGLIDIGRAHGLTRIRVPAEPPAVLAACGSNATLSARALYRWTARLRRQATRAGLQTDAQVFGIAWTGHMTADRLLTLAQHLPPAPTEIYFHPALAADATTRRLMPGYEPAAELAALCNPLVATAFSRTPRSLEPV